MNGFSFPYENDVKYDKNEEELNKKIKEYKEVYYNNQIPKYNENCNNNNQILEKNNIPSSENVNLTDVENEYDTYISNLKIKLNQEREERRKKEEEFILIQHRLIVLKNQEKSKILQLRNIKQHIDKIINNRIKSQEKLNEKLTEKRNTYKNTNTNLSWIGKTNYKFMGDKSMSKSQNNFYNIKQKRIEINKKETNQNKNDFKQILLQTIKKDEEEKKKIEEEIAKIEEEENNLLFQLSNRKLINN